MEIIVSVEQDVRALLEQSSRSWYAISRDTGIQQSQLSRFLTGQSLRSDTLEQLANQLGYEIVLKRKKQHG